MAVPEKYKVAIIGRTKKGDYGHLLDTVWLDHPRATIVAVADEHEEGRAAAVKRLGAAKGYADYVEMLDKEKPQFASVCPRWADCHRDMLIACAERGVNVYLEKPVARNLVEADEMVAATEKHHVKVAVAHQTRSAPRTRRVKELIAAGTLGDIVEVRLHGKTDARGGGEDLIVLGTHSFDLARYLVGDPTWCMSRITVGGRRAVAADVKQPTEPVGPVLGDHIFASFGLPGKAVATYTSYATTDKSGARYWTEIRGTKGIVQLGFGAIPPAFFSPDPTWMSGSGKVPWQLISSDGLGKPEPLTIKDVGNWNRWIVDDLIEAVEKDRLPMSSLADGRASLEMIMAVYESHRLDRPVEFPLKTRKHPLSLL